MVDCRPAAGAPPHELSHAAPNGAPPPQPENNHHAQLNQQGGAGDMSAGGAPSPAARASTPASTLALPTYGPGVVSGGAVNMAPGMGYAPYYGGGKLGGVLWMPPPPPPAMPPPPHHVNPHVFKSVQPNGSDLPMNDIPTLRYYFNLGVECMWAAYGAPPAPHLAHPLTHPPQRQYAHRDIAQDMQAMSLGDREPSKHKSAHGDKPPLQGKGNGQRTLLGPRFNKRGNQDGNQNSNHNQNKNHNNNNNMINKGPNNRRNSHDSRAGLGAPPGGAPVVPPGSGPGAAPYEGECVEAGLVQVPYMPYPPPVYPLQYYPIDTNDPGMMAMMGGMGYVNYEEGAEYVQPAYYPHPLYPAHAHAPPHTHPPPHPHAPAVHPLPPQHNTEHK